ncbi:MAG: PAS domain S-box protein, partial [Anaerolineae bacterium]
MSDRENEPMAPEFLHPEDQGLSARVAELESLLQACQHDAATLRCRIDRYETLQSAVLDMAALPDGSLYPRILGLAVRLLDASDGLLDLGERGQFSHVASAGTPQRSVGQVLAAPVVSQGTALGTIQVMREARAPDFSADDRELLSAFAAHAAVALDKQWRHERTLEELAECRLREQQSKERHSYLERLLACAPDAIVTLDAEHRVLEWNPGAEILFGYTELEAKGKDLDGLIAAPDPAMLEEAVSFTQTVLDGRPLPPQESVRFRKDGTPVDVMLAGSPIVVEEGLVGTVAVYTDITERKRAEKALARHAREMAALYETSLEINAQPDLSTLLSAIVRRATELVEARQGSMYLLEEHASSLELVVLHNLPASYIGLRLKAGEGLAGRVVLAGEPMMIADY